MPDSFVYLFRVAAGSRPSTLTFDVTPPRHLVSRRQASVALGNREPVRFD